jgi:hypothetical protein
LALNVEDMRSLRRKKSAAVLCPDSGAGRSTYPLCVASNFRAPQG